MGKIIDKNQTKDAWDFIGVSKRSEIFLFMRE